MTNPFSFLSPVFLPIRNIKATLAKRDDSEHEQAIIRIVIVFVVLVYLIFSTWKDGFVSATEKHALEIAFMVFVFSLGLLARIAIHPGTSPQRRLIGMVTDIGATCYVMQTGGEVYSPFYIILLWVTFGNGFRYGRKYLFVSTVLSVVGFSLVILMNDFWRTQLSLAVGLLIGLFVLPLYVSSLLKKLTNAISRAEEANRSKNQFLANMSHEMRTPLSGILGMVELLRGTPQTVEQEDFSNTIQASAQTLLFLIEDVLDISKIEAGKITEEKVDFDLHALVKSTMAMLAPQAREKGLDISSQIPSRIPFLLRGDPLLIRQVLLNLLSNAVKFTEEGEVCLRAEQIRETPKSVLLQIEVSDTGIGILPEAQARIFERFTQADDSITRRYGGSGLGTTIAKQLVELMGGGIGLQSEPGKGTTFWFTLELEKQHALLPQATGTSVLSGSRILVISSDGNSSFTLKKHLASWGVEAVIADRAAQAFSPLISAANDGIPYQIAIIVENGLDMDPCDLAKALKSVRLIQNVQLILVSREEREPELNLITKHGFASAVGASLDKTLLFNAVHYVRPVEGEAASVPSLARRYRQKKEEERRGLRILVAEDNLTNQKVIAKILERAGHQTRLVMNGEEALDAMEKEKFDLVLLDLHMPVMGGLEAAKIFHFTREGASRTPLVALTADATQESRKACEEAGFDGYLTKPVEVQKFLELVDSLVLTGRKEKAAATAAPVSSSGISLEDRDWAGDVIDTATFHDLATLGGKGDFLERLIRIFLETGEQKVDNIETAILARDYGLVADLAHALKGSAGQIGAKRLAELCHQMSHTQPADLMKEGNNPVKALKEEFDRVRAALGKYVHQGGGRDGSYGKDRGGEGTSAGTLPQTFRNQ
jgi:two-component system sensor histidine kinase RpfC